MNAPLSRYLARFSTAPTADLADDEPAVPAVLEPTITLRAADLEARLAAAHDGAHAAAAATHAAEIADIAARHEAALADAVTRARAEWAASEAAGLLARIDVAMASLREALADGCANVLRPILADAVRTRTLEALEAAIARLLTDPSHPAIKLHAPADLIDALRARGTPDGLELVAADSAEATIHADGTRIETRLAAALTDLAGPEGR